MDNYAIYEEPESEIDLAQLFWNLLSQWKAILIVALMLALVVSGAKFLKDARDLQATVAAQEEEAQLSSDLTADERIESVLSGLPSKDRQAVEFITKQTELINAQQAYLKNSILLNSNPTNQHTLMLAYHIRIDGQTEALALADAYSAYLRNEETLAQLRQAIDADATPDSIRELVSVTAGDTSSKASLDSGTTDFILGVNIVLPDGANEDEVLDAAKATISKTCDSLSNTLGSHTAELASSSFMYQYNSSAIDRKATIITTAGNIMASIKNASASLTSEQKSALETITRILGEQSNASNSGEAASTKSKAVAAPSFSIKHALIGFVVGIFGYCIVYVVAVALSKKLTTAKDLEAHTMSRSLGSVFYYQSYTGLSKLFHSKLVDKFRYGNKGTVAEQSKRVASNIDSAYEHAGSTNSVAFLHIGSMEDARAQITASLVKNVNEQGIEANMVSIVGDANEKALLNVKTAIIVAGNDATTTETWKLTQLCRSYDVQQLGCVFLARK